MLGHRRRSPDGMAVGQAAGRPVRSPLRANPLGAIERELAGADRAYVDRFHELEAGLAAASKAGSWRAAAWVRRVFGGGAITLSGLCALYVTLPRLSRFDEVLWTMK